MTPDEQRRAAQTILEMPFCVALIDEMERAATQQCIFAPINDDETRRNAAAEARAVKRFRDRLEAMAMPGQSTRSRGAPA
jgi:hypothetical protein